METIRVDTPSAGWRSSAESAGRRLAAITTAGAVLGLLVGGVGGRLAMMLLARLNPEVTGSTSDDGFRMGQFTVPATVNLLIVGLGFGLVGAAVYAVVRCLMVGPRWFQVLSVAVGPAVVVGAGIVHTGGVDFDLLAPAWLAIAVFVAIPGVYAGLLTLVAERMLSEDGWFARAPTARATAALALWVVFFPLLPVLAVLVLLWVGRQALRRTPRGAIAVGHPAIPWAARAGLVAAFSLGLADLGQDAAELL
jgi:hypothetical protein